MGVVLCLHSYQTHLHHGEAQCCETSPPSPGVVQLIQLPWHHTAEGQIHTGWRQPGGQPLLGCQAVDHNANLADVVFCFSASTGDPRGLAQSKFPLYHQGVSRVLATAVGVVVLQGLEVAGGVEGVGAGEELWTRPNLTSEHSGKGVKSLK